MNIQENIQKIGYYKYKTHNNKLSHFANEYPITKEIINYVKKLNNIEVEFEGNSPKLINGKLIILV
jgi:hypothetical protein